MKHRLIPHRLGIGRFRVRHIGAHPHCCGSIPNGVALALKRKGLELMSAFMLLASTVARSPTMADGFTPTTHLHVCAAEINSALVRSNRQPGSHTHQTIEHSHGTPCNAHPWVRQLDLWGVQGMTLESAMQWLMVSPEQAGAVRLYPQLEGPMEDLARMRAAHALALSGHLPDATRLWHDLSTRRPEWAEVWFNMGLAAQLRGERAASHIYFNKASSLCMTHDCLIDAQTLEQAGAPANYSEAAR